MGLGWTRAYEVAVAAASFAPLTYEELATIAKASFGDAGDRYICPIERRAIRKKRRKARSVASAYIVHGRFGRPRRFKHRNAAIKHYRALKASYGEAYITNITLGISVKAPERVHPGKLLDLRSLAVNIPVLIRHVPNLDMFTRPSMLPKVPSPLPVVSREEIEHGPVIDSEPLGVKPGRLWAGQSSYISKRFEQIKESLRSNPVVQAFSTLPVEQKATLQALAGLYIGLFSLLGAAVMGALPRIAEAAPFAR